MDYELLIKDMVIYGKKNTDTDSPFEYRQLSTPSPVPHANNEIQIDETIIGGIPVENHASAEPDPHSGNTGVPDTSFQSSNDDHQQVMNNSSQQISNGSISGTPPNTTSMQTISEGPLEGPAVPSNNLPSQRTITTTDTSAPCVRISQLSAISNKVGNKTGRCYILKNSFGKEKITFLLYGELPDNWKNIITKVTMVVSHPQKLNVNCYSPFRFRVGKYKHDNARIMKPKKAGAKNSSENGVKGQRSGKSNKYCYVSTLSLKNCIKSIGRGVFIVELDNLRIQKKRNNKSENDNGNFDLVHYPSDIVEEVTTACGSNTFARNYNFKTIKLAISFLLNGQPLLLSANDLDKAETFFLSNAITSTKDYRVDDASRFGALKVHKILPVTKNILFDENGCCEVEVNIEIPEEFQELIRTGEKWVEISANGREQADSIYNIVFGKKVGNQIFVNISSVNFPLTFLVRKETSDELQHNPNMVNEHGNLGGQNDGISTVGDVPDGNDINRVVTGGMKRFCVQFRLMHMVETDAGWHIHPVNDALSVTYEFVENVGHAAADMGRTLTLEDGMSAEHLTQRRTVMNRNPQCASDPCLGVNPSRNDEWNEEGRTHGFMDYWDSSSESMFGNAIRSDYIPDMQLNHSELLSLDDVDIDFDIIDG